MKVDDLNMSTQEIQELKELLSNSVHNPPTLEDIWKLMDSAWEELGCDNEKLSCETNWSNINLFYKHPVWTLNGLFIEQHELSMQHRHVIANWICSNGLMSVLDYGGGFGTLARLIAEKNNEITINIYEPHPSQLASRKIKAYPNIHFADILDGKYDCLVSTDVLEHVPDPLSLLSDMIKCVKVDGYLVIANCFYPVIKCHLPVTFHFRYTFNQFAKMMGLEVLGPCEGSHATLYRKVAEKSFDWSKIRRFEEMSRAVYPVLELAKKLKNLLK